MTGLPTAPNDKLKSCRVAGKLGYIAEPTEDGSRKLLHTMHPEKSRLVEVCVYIKIILKKSHCCGYRHWTSHENDMVSGWWWWGNASRGVLPCCPEHSGCANHLNPHDEDGSEDADD